MCLILVSSCGSDGEDIVPEPIKWQIESINSGNIRGSVDNENCYFEAHGIGTIDLVSLNAPDFIIDYVTEEGKIIELDDKSYFDNYRSFDNNQISIKVTGNKISISVKNGDVKKSYKIHITDNRYCKYSGSIFVDIEP